MLDRGRRRFGGRGAVMELGAGASSSCGSWAALTKVRPRDGGSTPPSETLGREDNEEHARKRRAAVDPARGDAEAYVDGDALAAPCVRKFDLLQGPALRGAGLTAGAAASRRAPLNGGGIDDAVQYAASSSTRALRLGGPRARRCTSARPSSSRGGGQRQQWSVTATALATRTSLPRAGQARGAVACGLGRGVA